MDSLKTREQAFCLHRKIYDEVGNLNRAVGKVWYHFISI